MTLAQVATATAYLGLVLAAFALVRVIGKFVRAVMDLHRAVLLYLAEHELLMEDLAVRRDIARHNLRTMAMAAAASTSSGSHKNN